MKRFAIYEDLELLRYLSEWSSIAPWNSDSRRSLAFLVLEHDYGARNDRKSRDKGLAVRREEKE